MNHHPHMPFVPPVYPSPVRLQMREAGKARRDDVVEKLLPLRNCHHCAVGFRRAEVERIRFLADIERRAARDQKDERDRKKTTHGSSAIFRSLHATPVVRSPVTDDYLLT